MKKIALSLLTALLIAGGYIGAIGAQSSSSTYGVICPAGSATLPGCYFAGDRDTGIYRLGADEFGITTGGTIRARFNSLGVALQNNSNLRWLDSGGTSRRIMAVNSGNDVLVGDTDFALGAGSDSHVYGRDTLRFYTSDTERARFASDGSMLVGGTTDVAGGISVTGAKFDATTQAYWLKGDTTYTSGSGTYTVPTGVRAIRVRMVGGGGGGGYARAITTADAQAFGGGGQSGYYVELWMTGLSASYSYGVGAAGSGGVGSSSTAATAGGDTTFSTFTAKGGAAGGSVERTTAGVNVGAPGAGGAKSANGGAIVNARGRTPVPATSTNPYAASGQGSWMTSPGAGSHLSGETVTYVHAASGGANGDAGDAPGGGGGGGIAWRAGANLTQDGGAGAAGIIIIEEYF